MVPTSYRSPAIIITPQAHLPPDAVQQALRLSLRRLSRCLSSVTKTWPLAGIEAKDKVAVMVEKENRARRKWKRDSENDLPQVAAAAATESSIVPSSATSVVDNSTSPGPTATSTTSVSLPLWLVMVRGMKRFWTKNRPHQPRLRRVLPSQPAIASTSPTTTETTTAITTPTSSSSVPPKNSLASLLRSSESSSSASGSGRNIKCRRDIHPCVECQSRVRVRRAVFVRYRTQRTRPI